MDQRLNAVSAILERGVQFKLPAPFYKKWLKMDVCIIRPLKAGTILEISRIVLENNLEQAIALGDYQFLKKSIEPCVECIAVATLNDRKKIAREERTGRLKRILLNKVSTVSLIDLFMKVLLMNRVYDFMNITKFFWTQMATMMNPKNLGHEANGS